MIISAEHTISMGHRLPSYKGICSSLHGHNIRVVADVHVESGFFDFKTLAKYLVDVLADYDHAMVLWDEDPVLPLLEDLQMRVVALSEEPTTEAVAQVFFNSLSPLVSGTQTHLVAVTVYETSRYRAICDKRGDCWRVER